MEYVCRDPEATIRGQNVLSTVEAFQLRPDFVRKLLERHGIRAQDLCPEGRVRLQKMLDVLRAIAEQVGEAKLRNVGARIAGNAAIPPAFSDVESVLLALDVVYQLNHSGNVGRYRTRALEGGQVLVECETPYPRAFERGVVEGITRHAGLAQGRRYDVRYRDGAPGSDLTCTMEVIPL